MTSSITFIGAGNMAQSLIRGLLNTGYPASAITATDPVAAARETLKTLGINVSADNSKALEHADVIVLAVKPQVLGAVLSALDTLRPEQLLVSIAAGVPVASLRNWTCEQQAIVRCMPNTPALLGAGVTALYAAPGVDPRQRTQAEDILKAAGRTLWVDREEALDAVTAVSGSGPAYFFYLMEAMIEAGEALGLDAQTATLLTLETAYGAALMAREGSSTPTTLKENVTSPGGTTERALSILDAAGGRDMIHQALAGAASRSRELAQEFGQS